MNRFTDPAALAQAAFRAHLAGDSRALCEMTHPDAARRYYSDALHYLAGWLRLGQIRDAVESGALTPETVSSFRHDSDAPVEDFPLYHLKGVRVFGDIARLDPRDFLQIALAGGAEVFGYPPRPDDPWRRIESFQLSGTVVREGDVARVPYTHTQKEPDAPASTRAGELVALLLDGYWYLWLHRELFAPLPIFLHE